MNATNIPYPEYKNALTPAPDFPIPDVMHENLIFLLQHGISTRDIFLFYNYPLEWAIAVEQELQPVTEPEIIPE